MLKKINQYLDNILKFPRFIKTIIIITNDIFMCLISVWLAFFLATSQISFISNEIFLVFGFTIIFSLPLFWLFGFYRMILHSNLSAMFSGYAAMIVYGLLFFCVVSLYELEGVAKKIGILQPVIFFVIVGGSRLLARYIFDRSYYIKKKPKKLLPRALIYGAGSAGRQLVSSLERSNEMIVIGFIDDDHLLQGQVLQGKDIFSSKELENLILKKQITHILLALPSVKRNIRLQILKNINKYKVIVRTLPSIQDLVEGKVTISDVREPMIEDVLGRDQIVPNIQLLSKNITSKIVLFNGAGGSIGSELCRQIINLNPIKILLVEMNEYALYAIHSELEEIKIKNGSSLEIIPLPASVQDENRMETIIRTWKPDTLYHAAAYKHLPLVEQNVCEGIKNNVFGTLTVAKIAIENNVSDMVLISTDKAVRPTNVMGASKRLAELCLQALSEKSKTNKTKLSMVRFGNVLNSSGSVIPKFKKQIRDGGPVTLTHSEVTRYFMTIPEAAQLVIQASAMAEGRDVFVLDMGEPVKIKNLIHRMISLSGLSVQDKKNLEGDVKIEITGLRPGEKLYEELLLGDDPQPTKHPKIQKAQDPFIPWNELESYLNKLEVLIKENKVEEILIILKELVTGYQPNKYIVDQISLKQTKIDHNKKN
jgi:FlaA1/EpsC-like NDP-sugar epimerase